MGKVRLIREKTSDFGKEFLIPVKSSLPFYQREGEGYVHRIRSSHKHLDPKTRQHSHTSFKFWCGAHGFTYPRGKQNRKHAPAQVLEEPSPWRVVCATCEARAIGSGQLGKRKIGKRFVRFKPHVDFA